MPAYHFEQELARTDGARFLFNVVPVEILSERHRPRHRPEAGAHRRARMGRCRSCPAPNSSSLSTWSSRPSARKSRWSCSKSFSPRSNSTRAASSRRNPDTGQTNLPHVFTGGDCANGGREVVNAVAEGKKAARGIHAFLGGQKVAGPVQPSRYGVKGAPVGSGFDQPIRVLELEKEYANRK